MSKRRMVLWFSVFALLLFARNVSAQTVITGSVLSYQGESMPLAHVQLQDPLTEERLALVTVGEEGRFELTIAQYGLLLLEMSGVGHQSYEMVFYLEEPDTIQVDVRLGTPDFVFVNEMQHVRVVGGAAEVYRAKASKEKEYKLDPLPDGTFATEIETEADTFAYQFIKAIRSAEGISALGGDSYLFDLEKGYYSLVEPTQEKLRLVFDPASLSPSLIPATIQFEDETSRPAQFARRYATMQRQRLAKRAEATINILQRVQPEDLAEAEKQYGDLLHYPWEAEQQALLTALETEEWPALRHLLLVNYFDLGGDDAKVAKQALAEINPTAAMWSLRPDVLIKVLKATEAIEQYGAYLDQVLAMHSDPDVKAPLLFNRLQRASDAGDEEQAEIYYDALIREGLGTKYAYLAEAKYALDRRVMVGKTVPDFEVTSLDNPAVTVSNESLLGQVYLIDFWATWCGPCIAEMEELHQVYRQFEGKGFTILSVSVDEIIEDVHAFREAQWPLPWLNTVLRDGFDSEMAKTFELKGVPKPVLVNKKGEIIAMANELSREGLEQILKRVLANSDG